MFNETLDLSKEFLNQIEVKTCTYPTELEMYHCQFGGVYGVIDSGKSLSECRS